MGLFDKLFKRKNKNIENAIQDINNELFDNEKINNEEMDEIEPIDAKIEYKVPNTLKLEPLTKPIKTDDVALEKENAQNVEDRNAIGEIDEIDESSNESEVIDEVDESSNESEVMNEIDESSNESEVIDEVDKFSVESEVMNAIDEFSNESEVIDEAEVFSEAFEEDVAYENEEVEWLDVFEQTDDFEETIEEEDTQEEESPKKQGFMKRLFGGLTKTRENIAKGVDAVLSSFKQIDEELYEELEEALIIADFGVDTTLHIIEQLKAEVKARKITDPLALKPTLQEIITNFLTSQPVEEVLSPTGPTVLLVIGVNGVGKTTSIGKMSHLFKSQGKRVLVAAADTFRAAAIEQLNVWTDRAGVEIIKQSEGSDAAAVVFDAIAAAKSRKVDVLICDTAGRLQNKTNLMKELEKISRIIAREYPEAKKEILIVIDATTGQNALQQVKLFKEVADINGIILTKLDGTAKGGAIVSIYDSLKVPVKYIGVGEKIDELQPFNAEAFAKALFDEVE